MCINKITNSDILLFSQISAFQSSSGKFSKPENGNDCRDPKQVFHEEKFEEMSL